MIDSTSAASAFTVFPPPMPQPTSPVPNYMPNHMPKSYDMVTIPSMPGNTSATSARTGLPPPMPQPTLPNYTPNHPPPKRFILDTGATRHITSELSDFKTIRPVQKFVIGLTGQLPVTGEGTIELNVSAGQSLYLRGTLYVPELPAATRIISVAALNRDNNCTTHFDGASCWVKDQNGDTIATGYLSQHSPTDQFYTLTLTTRVTYPSSRSTTRPARVPTCLDVNNCGINGYYCGRSCAKWDRVNNPSYSVYA